MMNVQNKKNRGNFLEMLELLASYNEQVGALVLDNAPQNAKYSSHQIQKEILHVFARNVQSSIRHEIGDARFCLIVNNARDESKREQMTLVIRFVDRSGFIRERFLDIVYVKDTTASTLKKEISFVLSHYNLMFKILGINGMMVLVICMDSGIDCKLYSLMIALMHIMYIA
jgi:hypothetical protein